MNSSADDSFSTILHKIAEGIQVGSPWEPLGQIGRAHRIYVLEKTKAVPDEASLKATYELSFRVKDDERILRIELLFFVALCAPLESELRQNAIKWLLLEEPRYVDQMRLEKLLPPKKNNTKRICTVVTSLAIMAGAYFTAPHVKNYFENRELWVEFERSIWAACHSEKVGKPGQYIVIAAKDINATGASSIRVERLTNSLKATMESPRGTFQVSYEPCGRRTLKSTSTIHAVLPAPR